MAETAAKTAVQEAAENMDAGGVLLRRWLGCWLDLIVLAGLLFGPALAAGAFLNLDDQSVGYATAVLLGVCVLYFPVTEGIWGRSFGKLVTGLKVVDKHGRAPGFGRAIVRTLFRLIEVNPFLAGGVPAGIMLLCTKRKQRIGDLVANTYVLSADRLKQMADVDATLAAMRSAPAV